MFRWIIETILITAHNEGECECLSKTIKGKWRDGEYVWFTHKMKMMMIKGSPKEETKARKKVSFVLGNGAI